MITLQALHGLSDNETVDAVTFDLRWKAACGLPITAGAFSFDDVDVLAAAVGGFGSAESDLRGGQGRRGRDRGAGQKKDPPCPGFHRPR